MPEVGTPPYEMLLAVVDFIKREDRADLSLRQLAVGAGTSHRMLGYYFGTREQLLGLVMLQLSQEYMAHYQGRRPDTRVEAVTLVWARFLEPSNRLQTQLLFVLSSAAAAHPEIEIPALTNDLDNLARGLTALGVNEGLEPARSAREARLIVATLLGLYLDYYITRESGQVDDSYLALVEWVERSTASP